MEQVIAYCGLTCSDCPTFKATKANDNAERKRVAELWTKEYGRPFKPEDINCMGCVSRTGPVFSYCNICEIRKCGQGKNVKNCAYCVEYKCEKLSKLHEQASKAKETLDKTRKTIKKDTKT